MEAEVVKIEEDKNPEQRPENKNVEFWDDYLAEGDPNKRLKLATDYLVKDAGDVWLYLYSSLNQEVSKNEEQKEVDVSRIAAYVSSERETGEESIFIKNLVQYIELTHNQFIFKKSIEDGNIPLNEGIKALFIGEMARSAETCWQDFVKTLDVEPDPDLLLWLKNIIDNQKIVVYEPIEGKDNLQAILAYSKEDDKLVINPNLIPSKITGADFLLRLTHERGHFYKKHSEVDVSQMSQGDLVLDEFFAIMEQQRMFALSGDHFKASIRYRSVYEAPVDTDKLVIGNKLPNSDIVPSFIPGKISLVLFEAYTHALNQLTQSQKLETLKEMLVRNKSPEEIEEELKRLSIPKEPLIRHEEMGWRKADRQK